MALTMDPGEILREYNAAASKDKQVAILAELNSCRPMEIALILREQGADLTATWRARLAAHDRAEGRAKIKDPEPVPEPEPPRALTVGVLQELLGSVPGDTPVRILGDAGIATAAVYLIRADAAGTSFVLEIQREAEA